VRARRARAHRLIAHVRAAFRHRERRAVESGAWKVSHQPAPDRSALLRSASAKTELNRLALRRSAPLSVASRRMARSRLQSRSFARVRFAALQVCAEQLAALKVDLAEVDPGRFEVREIPLTARQTLDHLCARRGLRAVRSPDGDPTSATASATARSWFMHCSWCRGSGRNSTLDLLRP
jgi:hypothetical protein